MLFGENSTALGCVHAVNQGLTLSRVTVRTPCTGERVCMLTQQMNVLRLEFWAQPHIQPLGLPMPGTVPSHMHRELADNLLLHTWKDAHIIITPMAVQRSSRVERRLCQLVWFPRYYQLRLPSLPGLGGDAGRRHEPTAKRPML